MLAFLSQIIQGVKTDTQKIEVVLSAHKDIVDGLIQWVGKEYTTLNGKDKMIKAIDLIETLLKLPEFVQAFTPEVVSNVERFIQASYDRLKANGKI